MGFGTIYNCWKLRANIVTKVGYLNWAMQPPYNCGKNITMIIQNKLTPNPAIHVFRPLLAAAFGALIITVFLAASIAGASVAKAQGVVKSYHGSWFIACETPPGASSEQCALRQFVEAEDRSEIGLSVMVMKTADLKVQYLRILAPLGVLLPKGLGLFVDGKNIGNVFFLRCVQEGCYAQVVLEETLLAALKNGKTATFTIFKTPEEGIGIPVDLDGFVEGYDNLP